MLKKLIEKTKESLLNIIFPKREDEKFVQDFDFENIESLAKNQNHNNLAFSIFSYKDQKVKAMIWEMKYHRNPKVLDFFAKVLSDYIYEELIDKTIFSNQKTFLLTSPPITKLKMQQKGFCHTDLLCREIIKNFEKTNTELKISYKPDAMKKIKETQNQSKTKDKSERMKNLKGAFWADKKIFDNASVILIDDVLTTGATIEEMSKTIKNAGAKEITAFTIAH
jgi:ComF family protein